MKCLMWPFRCMYLAQFANAQTDVCRVATRTDFYFYFYLCVSVVFLQVCLCTKCNWVSPKSVGSSAMGGTHGCEHVGAGNPRQFLWKSSHCSELLHQFNSPLHELIFKLMIDMCFLFTLTLLSSGEMIKHHFLLFI